MFENYRCSVPILLIAIFFFFIACEKPKSPDQFSAENRLEKTLLDHFRDPDFIAKPMARFSIPDASAGIDPNDTIDEYVQGLAEAGFGGVEVVYLTYDNDYTNEQAEYAGWGSESWRELMKKIYRAANKVEGGFLVDVTLTANWPSLINTIDANDKESSQEIHTSYTRVTSEDLQNGYVQLNLPETRTQDGVGFFGTPIDIEETARFIFTDTLVSANLVRVAEVTPEEQMHSRLDYNAPMPIFVQFLNGFDKIPEPYILDFDSLQASLPTRKVTASDTDNLGKWEYRVIDGKIYPGSPAGIPTEAYCELMEQETGEAWDYQDTLAWYGPEPAEDADLAISYNGKMDENFNRKRLADWQYLYEADLSGVDIETNNNEEIKIGDWVIIATYTRGTGQHYQSPEWGCRQMKNSTYVTDFFSEAGTSVIQDYWEKHILDDELLALMDENNTNVSCFFEDSIEAYAATYFWTPSLMDRLDESYAYKDKFAAAVAGSFTAKNASEVARIHEDNEKLMGDLFINGRLKTAEKFADKYNHIFRMQTYGLIGFDISEAAALAGLGENEDDGDTARLFRGSLNMYNKNIVSMETMTNTGSYRPNWAHALVDMLSDLSAGNNRLIWHASAYSKAINGFSADWPGWDPFSNAHGEPWSYRQIYWDSMTQLTELIARLQAVMQNGIQKVDFAVVKDSANLHEQDRETMFQDLLDMGYSYNIISENIFNSENAVVSNNMLYNDGPAYKALVLKDVEVFSASGMARLISFAETGLPVVLVNSTCERVFGTENSKNNDEALKTLYRQLVALENVLSVTGTEELKTAFETLGVQSYADYEHPGLETSKYVDPANGTEYYYIYNNSDFDNEIDANIDPAADKRILKEYDHSDLTLRLQALGIPYQFDPLTGTIVQLPFYSEQSDGTYTLHIEEIASCDGILIGFLPEASLPSGKYVTSVDKDSEFFSIQRNAEGELLFSANKAGTYSISFSDDTTEKVEIKNTFDIVDLGSAMWDVRIDSYGPKYKDARLLVDEKGIQTVDPSETEIISISLGQQKLASWKALELSNSQLNELGISNADELVGKGYYKRSFNWEYLDAGGILRLDHGNDQIIGIQVNGVSVGPVNQVSDQIDISQYLKQGENVLEIMTATTLYNRARVEEYCYTAGQGDRTMYSLVDPYDYGLIDAQIIPFSQVKL